MSDDSHNSSQSSVSKPAEKKSASQEKSKPPPLQPKEPVAASSNSISIDDVPIEWGTGGNDKWLLMSNRSRVFMYTKDDVWKLSYSHYGIFQNNSDTEIAKVKAKVNLLDAKGNVVFAKDIDFRASFLPTLRPNDRGLTSISLYTDLAEQPTKDMVSKVRVDVLEAEVWPALKEYKPGVVTPYQMSQTPIEGMAFALRVRHVKNTNNLGSFGSEVTFEVSNTGLRPIKGLKLRLDFKDEGGGLVKSEESSPVMSIFFPLQSKESRVMKTSAYFLKKPIKTIDFTVAEIE